MPPLAFIAPSNVPPVAVRWPPRITSPSLFTRVPGSPFPLRPLGLPGQVLPELPFRPLWAFRAKCSPEPLRPLWAFRTAFPGFPLRSLWAFRAMPLSLAAPVGLPPIMLPGFPLFAVPGLLPGQALPGFPLWSLWAFAFLFPRPLGLVPSTLPVSAPGRVAVTYHSARCCGAAGVTRGAISISPFRSGISAAGEGQEHVIKSPSGGKSGKIDGNDVSLD